MFGARKVASDGLNSYCRECERIRGAERRALNPDAAKAANARYAANNPDLVKARKRAYRKRNSEKCKQARKDAYEKNKASELAKAKEYKLANKVELSRKDSERRKANPHLNRFYRSERRAAERQAKPSWYDSKKVMAMHVKASMMSGDNDVEWHVDHIVPLKSPLVCGLHWHGNMRVITSSENQSKSNRHWPDMP